MRAEGRAHVTKEYWDKTKQNRKKKTTHKNKSRDREGPCLPADWDILVHFLITFSKHMFHYTVETVSNTLSQSTVNRDRFEASGGRGCEEGFALR